MKRAEIESELIAWMSSGDWRADPERFERLALALFEFQYANCKPYALLCDALDRVPGRVDHASEIPAVPTGAFKEFELRCFSSDRIVRTFRTSGTSLDRRGELHLDRVDLYEASLLASLRHALLAETRAPGPNTPRERRFECQMRFLAASPEEAPDSSLSYMFGALLEAEGRPGSGFDLEGGNLNLASLRRAVDRARQNDEPMLVAGTAFAFVHFLDETRDAGWTLSAGSRIMETGGFKGRSREIPRDVLHQQIATRFGVERNHVLNQYGMTELGSQFYDSTLVDPTGPRRKLVPPWTRVRFLDPASGEDAEPGEVGMILIQDLANTGSVAAIQTADLGRAVLDEAGQPIGFDVLGRAEGAEARGCSIATDIMLEASGGAEP